MPSVVLDVALKPVVSASPVAATPARCIFDEDWWLDAAAPGAWDRVGVAWDYATVGEMAFHVRKRWGLTFIDMPPLTRTMSPRLFVPEAKPVTSRINALSIIDALVGKLPRHDRFERALEPDCPSVQGFVHANLTATHTFTYRSAPGAGPERLLADAHQKTRNVIIKAQRECAIERSTDLDRFMRLHVKDYGDANTVDYLALQRLFAAAAGRGRAEIIFASQGGKADTAAAIVVWDRAFVYYWLTARDPAQSSTGANSLIIFEAMKAAHRKGCGLDLDGYVQPAVSLFLMKFGLEPVVRPFVSRSSPLWKGLNSLTTLARPNRPDRHYRV